jgi:hypothetical protein
MGGCYLLKYNGGDSGIKIFVLYWRRSLIRVSVIRGSTVYITMIQDVNNYTMLKASLDRDKIN